MCAAGTLTLQEGRQKVGSATTGLIQGKKEKKKADHRIQRKYCHQCVFSFMPLCTERINKKRYFPPFESVRCSQDRRAWVCVKFKFLMTAQGKRKENNEIKPLPPDLGWDVTTCLFSPAPVFSQLSKFLCSCGSMIHLFRESRKKKKEEAGGKKKQQLFFASLFHLWLQAPSVCLLGPKSRSKKSSKSQEAKGQVFREVKRLFPSPPGQVNERQFQA